MNIIYIFIGIGSFYILLKLGKWLLNDVIGKRMSEPPPPPVPTGVEVLRNIEYAKTPEQNLELDLYLPKEKSNSPIPVLIYIHGGAWRLGNRHLLGRFDGQKLAQKGFAILCIEYRLSGVAKFPAQIYDCKAAVRWVRKNADKYGFNSQKIGVFGGSAGGHLSALLGTSGDIKELEGNISEEEKEYTGPVQAVVDIMGLTDLEQIEKHRLPFSIKHENNDSFCSQFLGGRIPDKLELVKKANPLTYIQKGKTPPFLIFHGDKDMVVPCGQSRVLHEALIKNDINSEFIIMKGAGHTTKKAYLDYKVLDRMEVFFKKHLIID